MSSTGKIRRLLNLLERLQSGRTYNAGELADFCGVSRRTLFRDLKVLQESGVPILYDAERQGYWLTSGSFLPPTDLTFQETLSLLVLAQHNADSLSIPFQESARNAALKLLSNLPGDLRQHLGEVTSRIQIRTEPQPDCSSCKQHYQRILNAIQQGVKVRLWYDSLIDQQELITLVSPYQLFFQRRTWYVVGRSSVHRAVRTFHLGRIRESELTTDQYEIPPRFSLRRHLGLAWSSIRERNARMNIVLRFKPLVARNVAEVVWHPTQKLRWLDDGQLEFRVTVDGLREIVWWVLGYGHQVVVFEPQELRELILEYLQEQARNYGQVISQETGET